MSSTGLRHAREAMERAGVNEPAIRAFELHYGQLVEGATGLIPEDSISPMTEVPSLLDVAVDEGAAREALQHTAVIKLNGGLGTSMGMTRAKSLLSVRDGKTFLDIVVQQVLSARARYAAPLPLLLMNSFNTRADTLAALAAYPDLPVDGLPLDFMQSQEPKLRADDLTPVSWPANPAQEWCPPGHGDLYPSLLSSGILRALLDHGIRYANVSNVDNLGAGPDARLAGWFATSGAPYAAEVCVRTPMDRKGGHLAVRRSDGRLILRDTAQTADDELHYFTDEHRHPFFHTNNLWFDLERLLAELERNGGVLHLPLIRNRKTVDPTDKTSPAVLQIETAMGAAIELFEGAQAIDVPRSRFLPVKTTNELMLLRSDAYDLGENGSLERVADQAPTVDLDPEHYKRITDFEERFPHGVPSLREARRLTVEGDYVFGRGVVVRGEVTLPPAPAQQQVPDGTQLS